MSPLFETVSVPLHRIRVRAQHALSGRQVAQTVDLNVLVDDAVDQVVLRLEREIARGKLRQKTIQYPADWLEAVKERWLPAWALKRWPVRRVVHTIDVEVEAPHCPPGVEAFLFHRVVER